MSGQRSVDGKTSWVVGTFPAWLSLDIGYLKQKSVSASFSTRIRPAMCRYFVLFLVLLLPAQSVLAITASFCAHEQGPVQHLGHHQHQHVDSAPGNTDPGPLSDHPDCASHHITIAALLPQTPAAPAVVVDKEIVSFTPHLFSSSLSQRPERPKWPPAV